MNDENEIEKAIRETLVIENPQSIGIAVNKIIKLYEGYISIDRAEKYATHQHYRGVNNLDIVYFNEWRQDK